MNSLRRLSPTTHEKVWGTPLTEPWHPNPERLNIGELWFAASDQVPLLVKLLFTSGELSVQVHPGDTYARVHENSRGKTEMWHVLRAAPDAGIALGPRETLTKERLREASVSGEICRLLNWLPVSAGDTFFIPAGAIHAMGGGLVMCEVQQFSDVTYRLYDFDRGRELHLDRALDVASLHPYEGRLHAVPLGGGRELLVECPYFRAERLTVRGRALCPSPSTNTLYIALEGEGLIGGHPFRQGEVWEGAAGISPVEIQSHAAAFLMTSEARFARKSL